MASPLFYGGGMGKLDPFTLNVLCNPEVIDIDQDPLGQSASVSMTSDSTFLVVKDLEDGSKALGLFNRGRLSPPVTASWALLGLKEKQSVRDLWREKDLAATVPLQGTPSVPEGINYTFIPCGDCHSGSLSVG
jgi:alpha-galactosidase